MKNIFSNRYVKYDEKQQKYVFEVEENPQNHKNFQCKKILFWIHPNSTQYAVLETRFQIEWKNSKLILKSNLTNLLYTLSPLLQTFVNISRLFKYTTVCAQSLS
jgi:hypothetical protein